MLSCKMQGHGALLVLVHGIASDSRYFDPAVELLKEHFTVVTYDRRGYSDSPAAPNALFDTETQGADLQAVINAVSEAPVLLAACSAGGLVALECAIHDPARVRLLVLYEPPIAATPQLRLELHEWQREIAKLRMQEQSLQVLKSLHQVSGGADDTEHHTELGSLRRNLDNLDVFLAKEQDSFLSWSWSHTDPIALQMPCVLAVGKDDQAGLFSRMGESAARQLGATFVRLQGYHNLAWEKPEVFSDFLNRCDSSPACQPIPID